jgi:HK97 family phage prohead protease
MSDFPIEYRSFTDAALEVRDTADGRTLIGVAVPYGVEVDAPQGRERFVAGAFQRQIDSGQIGAVKFYASHTARLNGSHPIGKTARLTERADALHGAWRLFDTTAAEDALVLVRAREVTGLSIGFRQLKGGTVRGAGGIREHRYAHLDHVVLTDSPIYAGAQVMEVRSKPLALHRLEFERFRIVL